MEPQQVPPQQCPVGNHCPDPEIESAIANMKRHEQASSMPSTESNNNHGEGVASAAPSLHTTLISSHHFSSPSGIQKTEDWRLKAQDHC